MPTLDVVVPDELGDEEEGVVVTWLKREGDPIHQNEPLFILQVEKISYEIPAPANGRVTAILAPQGAVVKKGQVVAQLEVAALPEAAPAAEAPAKEAPAAPPPPSSGEVRASPIARRLAREHNIDLSQVTGTGSGGRITEKDVLAFIEARQAPSPSTAPTEQTIPLSGMRGAIARRMHQSLQEMAQLTLHTEVDVTGLVLLREELKQKAPITYTDLLVRACALALQKHPLLNATLDGEVIRLLPDINIGLAIALENGLIVPVIHHADRLSLAEISRTRQQMAERARTGQLSAEEISGGTFTITNLGNYGIDAFTPIINPPEVAILGVGRILEKVVIHAGKIAQRAMMTLSLTIDHRVVDGAPAAAFLQTLSGLLAEPGPLAK